MKDIKKNQEKSIMKFFKVVLINHSVSIHAAY